MRPDDTSNYGDNRRRFLKKMVAAGSAAAIAGCSSNQDGGDTPTETQTTTVEITPSATPEPDVEYEVLPEYDYISLNRGNYPTLYEEGVLYRQMLGRLGFRFNTDVLQIGALVERLLPREWAFTNLRFEGSPENLMPYSNLSRGWSREFIGDGEPNYNNWTHPQYQEALEKFVRSTQDEEYAIELCHYMQEILALNQPLIWVCHPDSLSIANTESFSNWQPMPSTMTFSNRYTLENIEKTGDKNTVVWGQVTALDQFPTPMGISGMVGTYLKFLYMDHLVDYDGDANLVGRAAESWEFIEPNVIQIQLRDDMVFHDGEDVTAHDVKFTWDYITEHGYPDLAADIASYESSEVIDDQTVNITLANPSIAFEAVPMFLVFILPQHVWVDVMDDNPDLSHPREWDDERMTIGSGPFEFVEYEPGDRVVFEKFDDYYDADRYAIDKIIYRQYGNNSTLVSDVSRDIATIGQMLNSQNFNRAKESPNIKATANGNVGLRGLWVGRINNSEDPEYRFGPVNEPFNDVYVRQALAHAINDQRVIELVHGGYATEATNFVAPANEKYYYDGVTTFESNLEKARDLLVESGLRYDESGRLMKPVDWTPRSKYISPGEVPTP